MTAVLPDSLGSITLLAQHAFFPFGLAEFHRKLRLSFARSQEEPTIDLPYDPGGMTHIPVYELVCEFSDGRREDVLCLVINDGAVVIDPISLRTGGYQVARPDVRVEEDLATVERIVGESWGEEIDLSVGHYRGSFDLQDGSFGFTWYAQLALASDQAIDGAHEDPSGPRLHEPEGHGDWESIDLIHDEVGIDLAGDWTVFQLSDADSVEALFFNSRWDCLGVPDGFCGGFFILEDGEISLEKLTDFGGMTQEERDERFRPITRHHGAGWQALLVEDRNDEPPSLRLIYFAVVRPIGRGLFVNIPRAIVTREDCRDTMLSMVNTLLRSLSLEGGQWPELVLDVNGHELDLLRAP